MDPEMKRQALSKAADLGISFSEYVRRLVARDLREVKPKADVSALFDYVKGGPATNIARDKDRMVGEAVWDEHLRSIGRKPRLRVGKAPR